MKITCKLSLFFLLLGVNLQAEEQASQESLTEAAAAQLQEEGEKSNTNDDSLLEGLSAAEWREAKQDSSFSNFIATREELQEWFQQNVNITIPEELEDVRGYLTPEDVPPPFDKEDIYYTWAFAGRFAEDSGSAAQEYIQSLGVPEEHFLENYRKSNYLAAQWEHGMVPEDIDCILSWFKYMDHLTEPIICRFGNVISDKTWDAIIYQRVPGADDSDGFSKWHVINIFYTPETRYFSLIVRGELDGGFVLYPHPGRRVE